jgi:hypothetical protein
MASNAPDAQINQKRERGDEEGSAKRAKTDEDDQMEAECPSGIEIVLAKAGAATLQLAFKASMPATREHTQVRDVICGLDNTRSMETHGADEGLVNTVHNFGSLVDMCMKDAFGSTEEGKRAQEGSRATTLLHAFRFGNDCASLHGESFFPLTRDAIAENIPKIEEGMNFSDGSTNIEEAVLHAGRLANKRLEDMLAHDLANSIDRRVCIVLLTDGSPNEGSRDPEHILHNLDLTADKTLPIYGIGLGTNTNPLFLSEICRNGFWKHVDDPAEPKEAFDATLGYIVKAIGECEIDLRVSLERDGKVVPGAQNQFETKRSFGLVTADKHRARVLRDLALPFDTKAGDTLIIDYKFSTVGERSVAKIEVTAHDHPDPPIHENMVVGLMKEAEDIESMMDAMRTSITRGSTVDDASQELMTTFRRSSAVQSQIRRVAEICEQSLSCLSYASSVGTASFLPPRMPGLVRSDPVHPSALPPLEPSYSVFEAESSFSQF